MSFWDDFKDLFKTKKQIEEEKAAGVGNALKREKELADKLQKLEEEYNSSLPKDEKIDFDKLFPKESGLEKIDVTLDSDEALKEKAENNLKHQTALEKENLNDIFSTKKKSIEKEKSELKQNADSSMKKIEELYAGLKQNAENNALKRGLGRSSIIMSQIQDYDSKNENAVQGVQKDMLEHMKDIEQTISNMEVEKESALQNLDLKHASELSKELQKLEKDRNDTFLKLKKYNDEIDAKEKTFQGERNKKIDSYKKKIELEKSEIAKKQAEEEAKNGYSGEKRENYAKRYELAFDFYNSLEPEVAVTALQASPNMKYFLGNNYSKLMDVMKGRMSGKTRYF